MPDPIPRNPFDQGLFLTHYNKGREFFEARRFDEAERQLEEAYLLRPRDPRVLNLLGLVYFRGQKLDKAEEVYRELATESPEAHILHYNLGLICLKLGRLEDALSSFLKALELTQGNPRIHYYLGAIYEELQRYKDAIYQYRQAGANVLVGTAAILKRARVVIANDSGPAHLAAAVGTPVVALFGPTHERHRRRDLRLPPGEETSGPGDGPHHRLTSAGVRGCAPLAPRLFAQVGEPFFCAGSPRAPAMDKESDDGFNGNRNF